MSEQYSRAENTHRHRSPSRNTWDDGEARLDTSSHAHGRHVDDSFLDQPIEAATPSQWDIFANDPDLIGQIEAATSLNEPAVHDAEGRIIIPQVAEQEASREANNEAKIFPITVRRGGKKDAAQPIRGAMNEANVQSRESYRELVKDINPSKADQAARQLYEAAKEVKSKDDTFQAPAVFMLNRAGELAWSASSEKSAPCLVRVRPDGSVERLGGEGEKSYGVVHGFGSQDDIYQLSNSVADTLQAADQLNSATLKAAARIDDADLTVIRTRLSGVLQSDRQKKQRQAGVQPAKVDVRQPVSAPDDAKQAAEAPIEGVVISHPEADDMPSSPDQPDVVVQGMTVDDSTSSHDPRPKKAKKAKKTKSPKTNQSTPSNYEPVTYGLDDQPFGPEELPLRHFVRTSETYSNARDAYDKADKELAGKVGRRLKLGMFATKKTREAASAEIESARPEYERMAEAFDAIQIEKWKLNNPDISDEEINHKLAKFHEAKLRLQGLRAQHEIIASTGKFSKLSEWNNKATEWYAGLSKKQKIGFAIGGIAVGIAAGGLVAAAGTVLGTAAGVAGGGLLAGAKVYKTSMQGRAGLHRNTAEVNKDDFKNADGSYKSIDDLRTQSTTSFEYGLNQRVEKADKVNKRAKWMTIASAALLGAGVAGHIDVVHDAYKVAGDHIAGYFGFSPEHHDIGITDSQGGGSAENEVPQYGSGDVNPNHQYDFARPEAPTSPPVSPVAPPSPEVVPPDMGGATELNPAGLDHFNEWANGHTVQPGESIWKLSRDYLQANGVKDPSVYQIDAVKDKVLAEFSAKGLVDGNGWLMAGQQLITK